MGFDDDDGGGGGGGLRHGGVLLTLWIGPQGTEGVRQEWERDWNL